MRLPNSLRPVFQLVAASLDIKEVINLAFNHHVAGFFKMVLQNTLVIEAHSMSMDCKNSLVQQKFVL